MRKVFIAVGITLCCALGFAQSSGAGSREQKPSQLESYMSWVHDAWKTVQEQGRPAAEQFVRQWPKRFQNMKQQVADLSKKAHDKVADMKLEEKKNLIIELWRVRKSLDLLSLLRPEVLQSLTGLDSSTVASLERQVQAALAAAQALGIRR